MQNKRTLAAGRPAKDLAGNVIAEMDGTDDFIALGLKPSEQITITPFGRSQTAFRLKLSACQNASLK